MTGPAIAGFILALVSAIALARFGEAGVSESGVSESGVSESGVSESGVRKDAEPPPRAAVTSTPPAGQTVAPGSAVAAGATVAAEVTAELTVDLTNDLGAEGSEDGGRHQSDQIGHPTEQAGHHSDQARRHKDQASPVTDGRPAGGRPGAGAAESSAQLPSGRKN
jgi:hypothetical protein